MTVSFRAASNKRSSPRNRRSGYKESLGSDFSTAKKALVSSPVGGLVKIAYCMPGDRRPRTALPTARIFKGFWGFYGLWAETRSKRAEPGEQFAATRYKFVRAARMSPMWGKILTGARLDTNRGESARVEAHPAVPFRCALRTAFKISSYPAQRQRLPARYSRISSSDGPGLSSSSAFTESTKPGVQ